MDHRESMDSLQSNQLRVVFAPEFQGLVRPECAPCESGAGDQRAHDQRWVTKHTDHSGTGYQPKPSFNHPDGAWVLEAPRAFRLQVRPDKRPAPPFLGRVPLDLACRWAVPCSPTPLQQLVVQTADGFVLLVSSPVVCGRIVDFAQVQSRGFQTADQQRGTAPVHAQHNYARRPCAIAFHSGAPPTVLKLPTADKQRQHARTGHGRPRRTPIWFKRIHITKSRVATPGVDEDDWNDILHRQRHQSPLGVILIDAGMPAGCTSDLVPSEAAG